MAARGRGDGGRARGDGDTALSYRRPYLSEEDTAILDGLRRPGESALAALRRILREAAARRPVEEALRAVEARLARLEAAGLRGGGAPEGLPVGAEGEADARAAVMRALRRYTDEEHGG